MENDLLLGCLGYSLFYNITDSSSLRAENYSKSSYKILKTTTQKINKRDSFKIKGRDHKICLPVTSPTARRRQDRICFIVCRLWNIKTLFTILIILD